MLPSTKKYDIIGLQERRDKMNTRIKELRNALDMTQTEFGERIGFSRPMVANLEGAGRAEVKDHAIHLLCKEYNVNEEWLRYGTGEMFKPKTAREELVDLTDMLLSEESTSFKNRLVSALAKLSEEQWDLLEGIIDEISKKE